MRYFIAVVVCVACVTPAAAQTDERPPDCWPIAAGRVVVRMTDGTLDRGTLLCLGADDFVLAGAGVSRRPLAAVREIVRPADPIWDGALKGSAVALIILAVCGGDCASREFARAAAGYALIGMTIDAIESHREVLYRSGERRQAQVKVRWRFSRSG